jgi:hypothetical protein
MRGKQTAVGRYVQDYINTKQSEIESDVNELVDNQLSEYDNVRWEKFYSFTGTELVWCSFCDNTMSAYMTPAYAWW